MSENIKQIYDTNPTTAMVGTDLLYLGRDPYGTSDDFAILFSNFQTSITQVGTLVSLDVTGNTSSNNFLAAGATTATAAGTTTLTVNSPYRQFFTGSTTQTVTMPVVSTLTLYQSWLIINNSSGVVTVQSSGGNTIQAMAANTSLLITCISLSGTGIASWNATYTSDIAGVTSITGTANQVIASASTGDVTLSLPQSINTAATPTFAGLNNGGAAIFGFNVFGAPATPVNYINIQNAATGFRPRIQGVGSDTDVGLQLFAKAAGVIQHATEATSNQYEFTTGSGYANNAVFNFANTGTKIYTFPDAGGTVAVPQTGTWTPVLAFGGGSTGITYTTQTGTYTQIGNVLYFDCNINLSNKGSSTGSASISGLPTAALTSNGAISFNFFQNLTFTGTSLSWVTSASASTIYLYQSLTASGASALSDTAFANNTNFNFSGFYFTA